VRLWGDSSETLAARRTYAYASIALIFVAAFSLPVRAAAPVLQRGYNASVTGATLSETILNAGNVGPDTFGMLFTLSVDDVIYAQPLYVPAVAISGKGTHNTVYVATMSDTIYAFDADTGGVPLWSKNLATAVGATPAPISNFEFNNSQSILGNDGILSTPVIDPSTKILYAVACTLENGTMAYRLHAVDIRTGAEPYGPGVLISGSYNGSTFGAAYETQRASLTLSGNQVIVAFGAIEAEVDNGEYVGWVMAYNKSTLQQTGIFATLTLGNRGGGVWQSGRPPVVDSAGNVYVFSGNGYDGGYDGVNNFGETALKFDPAQGLQLVDWFTPGDWSTLDATDLDLDSSGPMLVPGGLLLGGGKTGVLYVLNAANLGKYNANDAQVLQKENITTGGAATNGIRGGPVYWQRTVGNGGPVLYDWGPSDHVRAYPLKGGRLTASPSSQGSGSQNFPGGILALSADAGQPGSGVLWAITNQIPLGELHAFDADNVANELWNSSMNAARDSYGNYAKYVPPLVANGKVYVAATKLVAVYGPLIYTLSPTAVAFGNHFVNEISPARLLTVTNTGSAALPIASIKISGTAAGQFAQTNNCGTSVAVSGTCTISVTFKAASIGAQVAQVAATSSGSAGTQIATLSGTGIAAPYTASPLSLTFGTVAHGTSSAPQSVTVKNTGSATLTITNIKIAGAAATSFSQTNNCGNAVPVGGSCAINVVFKPTTTGAATAAVNVNAAGGAGTQSVTLQGTGS
jgi:hypothetical protein